MLIDADLPQSYWYDALLYTTHIHNVTPTQALNNITPEDNSGCSAFVTYPT